MEEIWPDEKKKKEFIPRTPVTRIIQCAPVYSENEVYSTLLKYVLGAEIQTKVLRVFLLAIHSHLYRFSFRFLYLQTHATSYSFCNGERRKTG
jgi:hypothetical protein